MEIKGKVRRKKMNAHMVIGMHNRQVYLLAV